MTALARVELVAGWLAGLLGAAALWLSFYARIDCPAGDPLFSKNCFSWVEAPDRVTFPPTTLADLNFSAALLCCILLSIVTGVTAGSVGTSHRLHGEGLLLLWLGVAALFFATSAALITGGILARLPVGQVPLPLRGTQNTLLPALALAMLAAVAASARLLSPIVAHSIRSAAVGSREHTMPGEK